MHRLLKVAILVAAACPLAACAGGQRATLDPNPPPPRGYRVICSTGPGILNPVFNNYKSTCEPVLPAYEGQVVIRAKG